MGNRIIDDKLCKNGNKINWKKSVGKEFVCIYKNKEYNFVIKDYKIENSKSYVYIFNDIQKEGWIKTGILQKGQVGKILKFKSSNFRYNIGDIYNNMLIINRRKNPENKIREYQIKCLICDYDMSNDIAYKNGFLYKDQWKTENNINSGRGCSCCASKIVVPGINDIPTTAPWMVKFFQGGYDEAKLYTKTSGEKIYPICPDCGRVKSRKVTISHIERDGGISCICNDHISYPNKFAYMFLTQLPITNYKREFQPEWIKPYSYDNYFEYNGNKYIVEMDGGLGHGHSTYKHKKDVQGLLRDEYKNDLAKKHNINIIRINCLQSDLNFIKTNIFNSAINDIFDLSNIDWNKCNDFAISNFYKLICNTWNHKEEFETAQDIANKLHCSHGMILNALHNGTKYGWCIYNPKEGLKNAKFKACKRYLKYITEHNIITNEKIIYYASILQIINLSDTSRMGIEYSIKHNTAYKNKYKYYFSTNDEIMFYNNNIDHVIKKIVNGHYASYIKII